MSTTPRTQNIFNGIRVIFISPLVIPNTKNKKHTKNSKPKCARKLFMTSPISPISPIHDNNIINEMMKEFSWDDIDD